MRTILLVILILVTVSVKAQEINWISLEEAVTLQQKKPKKIMMDVYTVWCGPCKMLDRNTFQNKDVANYVNEFYYAVKFNAEGNDVVNFKGKSFKNPNYDSSKSSRRNSAHELTRYLQVQAYPSIVFFDENLNLLTTIKGYQNPQQFELYVKLFKEDKHKEMDTQEKFNEYYQSFKSEFKSN